MTLLPVVTVIKCRILNFHIKGPGAVSERKGGHLSPESTAPPPTASSPAASESDGSEPAAAPGAGRGNGVEVAETGVRRKGIR